MDGHRKRNATCFLFAAILTIALSLCACAGGGTDKSSDAAQKRIGFYADAADPYYQQIKEVLERASADDPDTSWRIDFKVGRGTAEDQLKAVSEFIAAGCDAVVAVQNNADTTGECIGKCKMASIPYFGAVYDFSSVANAKDSAGSVAYDFQNGGYLAGLDALNRGVGKVINVEGEPGRDATFLQTLGFLKAYEDAGKSLGGYTAEQIAAERPSVSRLDGTQQIEIVFWLGGADAPAKNMEEAVTILGKAGFDAIYAHNGAMAEQVIAAMQDAGLSADNYWIGSMGGTETSWDWAEDGLITMDVNRPATLEGILLYQQLKAYFGGEAFRAHLRPYFTPYTKENIAEKRPVLVPTVNMDAFMQGYKDGAFVTDINDPIFADIEAFNE
jgi:ABC-type sugar transport system substrate-binding protein